MKALQITGQVLVSIAMIPFIPLMALGVVVYIQFLKRDGYL